MSKIERVLFYQLNTSLAVFCSILNHLLALLELVRLPYATLLLWLVVVGMRDRMFGLDQDAHRCDLNIVTEFRDALDICLPVSKVCRI